MKLRCTIKIPPVDTLGNVGLWEEMGTWFLTHGFPSAGIIHESGNLWAWSIRHQMRRPVPDDSFLTITIYDQSRLLTLRQPDGSIRFDFSMDDLSPGQR